VLPKVESGSLQMRKLEPLVRASDLKHGATAWSARKQKEILSSHNKRHPQKRPDHRP